MSTAANAQRHIDAVDRRIDAVRAELIRRVGVFDDLSVEGWQRAWDSYPGLQAMESSLFRRRGDWQAARDAAAEREYRADQCRQRTANRKLYAKAA